MTLAETVKQLDHNMRVHEALKKEAINNIVALKMMGIKVQRLIDKPVCSPDNRPSPCYPE